MHFPNRPVFAQMFFNFPLFGRGQGLIPSDEVDKVKRTIYLLMEIANLFAPKDEQQGV